MSDILARMQALVRQGQVSVSRHGFRELAADDILLDDVTGGVAAAMVIEEYPEYFKGPSVLVLQRDAQMHPIHVLWGLHRGTVSPTVIVTAYRPDAARWSPDFLRRKQ